MLFNDFYFLLNYKGFEIDDLPLYKPCLWLLPLKL